MSQSFDTSAISLPLVGMLLALNSSLEQTANVTVGSSAFLAVQALSSTDSHMNDASKAEDIEMTIIKKTTAKTTNEEKRADDKTVKKPIGKKTAFKRKFSSEKDATRQISLSRLRPSAPCFQTHSSTPSSKTLRGHHHIKSHLHTKPSSSGHSTWKASLTKVINDTRLRRAAQALGHVHSGLILQSPSSGTIALPTTQDRYNETLHVASQTSTTPGRHGLFFFPSSSSVSTSTLSSPLDVSDPEYADFCQSNITAKLARQRNDHASRRPYSIHQGRGGVTSQPVSLDPSALPFTPRPVLNSQELEIMQLAMAAFMSQNGSYHSFPTFSISSSASPFCLQPDLATNNTQIMAQDGVTTSTPAASTIIARLVPLPPTPQSSSPSLTSAPVSNKLVPPTTPSSRSARRPLPDLPTPPTPNLGSSSRFGDPLPRRKSHKPTIFSTHIDALKFRPLKRQNPFIDFDKIEGSDSSKKYYEINPIMRAYRLHKLKTDPESRAIGPYRKAAVWEFIGQTFEKGVRKGLKLRQRKRFQTYAAGAVPVPGTSSLSHQVMAFEEEVDKVQHDMEVFQEWGKLMIGEGDW